MPPLITVIGPTASGKTALAISLAQRFHGEIINADSRQVYRHMDIGTAKPTAQEQLQAPHHLLDATTPDETFSLGSFLSQSRNAIKVIQARDNLPILAGGTGQYIWALLEGWDVPEVPPDPTFRQAKELEAAEVGSGVLYQELKRLDPQRAAELDPNNLRRIIRALEIFHTTGRKPSDMRKKIGPSQESLIIGLTMDRQQLYQRIDNRVDAMMAAGFLAEVQLLADLGYRPGAGPLDSPGYRELGQHLSGEISLEDAVQRTKFQTHRLARRQYTWFKLNDLRIHWFNSAEGGFESQAASLVDGFLQSGTPVIQ